MTTISSTSRGEILPPPSERSTVQGWILKNLFNNWYNTLLTLVTLAIVILVLRGILGWAFTEARWAVIPANLRLFFVGQYPSAIEGARDFVWRIYLVVYLISAVAGLAWGVWVGRRNTTALVLLAVPVVMAVGLVLYSLFPNQDNVTFGEALGSAVNLLVIDVVAVLAYLVARRVGQPMRRTVIILMLLLPLVAFLIIRGVGAEFSDAQQPFAYVPTRFWGGLLLSLILAVSGIVLSFPIGVILALGRQSKQPVMKTFSVIYIEFIRGVPLISLLFMGQVMLPLFLPQGVSFDRVLRALVAITMFSAAYLAENVRGGLQSIPNGQFEAGHAVGLSGFQTMFFIILPQALRAVIPVMVGQFIGLFKDTTLVAIVGLLDLLGIARGVIANPNYIGTQREVFLFISGFYFVFSFALSSASRRLEVVLGVGER